MKVSCEIKDYANKDWTGEDRPNIIIRSLFGDTGMVELEVRGEICKVDAEELMSAITRTRLNCFGN